MNFNLLVTFLDGTNREVSGIAADLVAFEAHFDLSVARLNADMKITHLLSISGLSLWKAWRPPTQNNAGAGGDFSPLAYCSDCG